MPVPLGFSLASPRRLKRLKKTAGKRRSAESTAREERVVVSSVKGLQEPIIVRQRPLETTRTPNRSCYWLAECEIRGRRYEARSRHGAPNELARQLLAEGVDGDRPMHVLFGEKVARRWCSVAEPARWTYSEGDRVLHRQRYTSPENWRAFRPPKAQKGGESLFPVLRDTPEPEVHEFALPDMEAAE